MAPDGAGRDAEPNAILNNIDLTIAWLQGKDLFNASFSNSDLTDTDFTDTVIQQADFRSTTDSGFTATQLYSTASYKFGNLRGISFTGNDLSGWNFSEQDLTTADLGNKTILTGTDFSEAEIRGVDFSWTTEFGFTSSQFYSTASYQLGDLSGISLRFNDLTGWDFSNQNLSNSDLAGLYDTGGFSILTNADFNGAIISGTDFSRSLGFTSEQLYSTSSYQVENLTGIQLSEIELSGWNFSGQKTINANFIGSNLDNADFSQAKLTNSQF